MELHVLLSAMKSWSNDSFMAFVSICSSAFVTDFIHSNCSVALKFEEAMEETNYFLCYFWPTFQGFR